MHPPYDTAPSLAASHKADALPANIRARLVAGASRLAIATIMRRKAASAALN